MYTYMYIDEGSEEAASADAKERGETTGATRSTQRGNRYNPYIHIIILSPGS
jgi:hypothetical protein